MTIASAPFAPYFPVAREQQTGDRYLTVLDLPYQFEDHEAAKSAAFVLYATRTETRDNYTLFPDVCSDCSVRINVVDVGVTPVIKARLSRDAEDSIWPCINTVTAHQNYTSTRDLNEADARAWAVRTCRAIINRAWESKGLLLDLFAVRVPRGEWQVIAIHRDPAKSALTLQRAREALVELRRLGQPVA